MQVIRSVSDGITSFSQHEGLFSYHEVHEGDSSADYTDHADFLNEDSVKYNKKQSESSAKSAVGNHLRDLRGERECRGENETLAALEKHPSILASNLMRL
jgi:hypothetical protein